MLSFKIIKDNTTYRSPSPNGDFVRVMVKTRAGTHVFDAKANDSLWDVLDDIENNGRFLRCQGYAIGEQPRWEVGA